MGTDKYGPVFLVSRSPHSSIWVENTLMCATLSPPVVIYKETDANGRSNGRTNGRTAEN
jgi:hypothetical protein